MVSFYLRFIPDADTNYVLLFISHIIAPKNSELERKGLPSLIALFLNVLPLNKSVVFKCLIPIFARRHQTSCDVFVLYQINALSIIMIMNVCIERNNLHLELICYRKTF